MLRALLLELVANWTGSFQTPHESRESDLRTTDPDFVLKQSSGKSLPVCNSMTFTEFCVKKFAVVYQYG